MKKKIVSVLLALSMAATLAACGSSNSTGQGQGTSAAGNADSAAETAENTDTAASGASAADGESDLAYIKEKGTLIVGITDFAPMDYREEGSDEWIGFDADLAKKVGESLGVDVQFTEINWDSKQLELENKSVDVVWNGMTLTDEVTNSMECTKPYLRNAQVVVVNADKADQYQSVDSLKDLSFAVEGGSAGMEAADENGLNYTQMDTQADAVMEVNAGTSDACIIDLLMAGAMIGKGTSYENLTYTVELTEEQYGIGCRKGSDLADYINTTLAGFEEDGSLKTLAEQYGVQESLIPLGDNAAEQ